MPFPKFDLGVSSNELRDYILKEAKVAISSGHGYSVKGEGHLRINIARSETLMTKAMDTIKDALSRLSAYRKSSR